MAEYLQEGSLQVSGPVGNSTSIWVVVAIVLAPNWTFAFLRFQAQTIQLSFENGSSPVGFSVPCDAKDGGYVVRHGSMPDRSKTTQVPVFTAYTGIRPENVGGSPYWPNAYDAVESEVNRLRLFRNRAIDHTNIKAVLQKSSY